MKPDYKVWSMILNSRELECRDELHLCKVWDAILNPNNLDMKVNPTYIRAGVRR